MTEERDPFLQQLFAEAEEPLEQPEFRQHLVEAMDRRAAMQRLRARIISALGAVALLLLAPVLYGLSPWVTGPMTAALVTVESPLLAQLLTPVNSATGLLGLLFLLTFLLARRLADSR